jgi:hypothetical protein
MKKVELSEQAEIVAEEGFWEKHLSGQSPISR